MATFFSEYVSLGVNCEGAFQIRRVLGSDSSSFFSWNVTPLESLAPILRARFAGILLPNNISKDSDDGTGLLNDSSFGYKFHSPFTPGEFENPEIYRKKLEDHAQKTTHLIDKMLRQRAPDEKTVYFYKYEAIGADVNTRASYIEIRDLLAEIHGASSFALVVLQHENSYEEPWQEELIFNRYLKRTSPWSDATDGHVQSWDAVFREFPHSGEMRLAGY